MNFLKCFEKSANFEKYAKRKLIIKNPNKYIIPILPISTNIIPKKHAKNTKIKKKQGCNLYTYKQYLEFSIRIKSVLYCTKRSVLINSLGGFHTMKIYYLWKNSLN